MYVCIALFVEADEERRFELVCEWYWSGLKRAI